MFRDSDLLTPGSLREFCFADSDRLGENRWAVPFSAGLYARYLNKVGKIRNRAVRVATANRLGKLFNRKVKSAKTLTDQLLSMGDF